MALSQCADSIDYYERDPKAFADRYDSVAFEDVHPHVLTYLPSSGSVLDVGAGSGRDARFMAARGLKVTAVEPSAGLRDLGARNSKDVIWIDDRLPDLERIVEKTERFDLILCSAVLMLVEPMDLKKSLTTFAQVLVPAGKLAINLRTPMPEEPPGIFFDHTDHDVLAAADAAGFRCLHRFEAKDALGRSGYDWRGFVFERSN